MSRTSNVLAFAAAVAFGGYVLQILQRKIESPRLIEIPPSDRGILYLSSNDIQYTGDMQDGIPDGIGTLKHAGRKVYEGDWINGLPQGMGTVFYENGKQVKGYWLGGELAYGLSSSFDYNQYVYKSTSLRP